MIVLAGCTASCFELLVNAFHPATVAGLMCRSTLGVSYGGELYDCDFNQILAMSLQNGRPQKLWDATLGHLENRPIATGTDFLALRAGEGSSCTGIVTG